MSVTGKKTGTDKKKWVIGGLCLIAVALSLLSLFHHLSNTGTAARAAAGGRQMRGAPGQQMPGTRGQIMTVTASTITLQARSGETKTFTLSPATQITVDQKAVTPADLKPGQRARVVSTDNQNASEVHVRTRPFGARGGFSGGARPPAGGGTQP